MGRFLAFVKKEFKHILRDYRTLLILLGMPIAQILIFGFAITNEIRDAKIAILDFAKDDHTRKITNKLLSSGYFILYNDLVSVNEIEFSFREGIIKEVILFEPDFGTKLVKENKANVQIIADASDPNLANMLVGYTSSIISSYQAEISQGKPLPARIDFEVKMLYNPNLKSVYVFVPGLISVILLLVSALMTSISITKEKELGTMEVLLVSPLNPLQIIVGKVIPYLLIAFINYSVIIVLAKFIFFVPISGSLLLLSAESLLFLITSLTLGIFISTISNNQQTALMISLVALMMPAILLSGYIFPIENMPYPLQIISNIIPARWFIVIVRGIMLKGVTFGYIWVETLVLAGMTLLLIVLSVKKFKIRLE